MVGLPNYDRWKLACPEDENPCCEHCGASEAAYSDARLGWRPPECDGQCGRSWRDPDAEGDAKRERELFGDPIADMLDKGDW